MGLPWHEHVEVQGSWVLEYYTLTLFLVLGSYYCYLSPNKYILFSRVYSKAKAQDLLGFRVLYFSPVLGCGFL